MTIGRADADQAGARPYLFWNALGPQGQVKYLSFVTFRSYRTRPSLCPSRSEPARQRPPSRKQA
jgi:hypothetical protein